MKYFELFWARFEEIMITVSLALMTLVTFVYVMFNNLYQPFFELADAFPPVAGVANSIAMFCIGIAQDMTWSVALTKLFFGMLIFLGASYGVRTAGHIGIDALVKLFKPATQRKISTLACLLCLFYSGLIILASYEWVYAMFTANIGAEDLQTFGIKLWHIGMMVPLGFALLFFRFLEVLIRLLRGQQNDLGLADEAGDAVKLQNEEIQQ